MISEMKYEAVKHEYKYLLKLYIERDGKKKFFPYLLSKIEKLDNKDQVATCQILQIDNTLTLPEEFKVAEGLVIVKYNPIEDEFIVRNMQSLELVIK